jgi:formate dehydrogenase subunit delta
MTEAVSFSTPDLEAVAVPKLVVGRWSLVVGRWSLVVGRWSLVVGLVSADCPRSGENDDLVQAAETETRN